jgi:hypothetical protein
VVRAPENSESDFWFQSAALENTFADSRFFRSERRKIRSRLMLIELFATACALSVVSLLVSIWPNNNDGELT